MKNIPRIAYLAGCAYVAMSLLVSCSSGSSPSSAETSPSPKVFTGGPAEYWAAMISCYGKHGIEAEPNGTGGIRTRSKLSSEEYHKISQECRDALGEIPGNQEISDSQLKARYQWRADQYRCLVSHGYLTGEPISFEEYRAMLADENTSWSPRSLVDKAVYFQAADDCPDSDKEW